MLKTNCKRVNARIQNYIIQNFDASNYAPEFDNVNRDDFNEICKCIITVAKRETPFLRNKNIYMLLEYYFTTAPAVIGLRPLLLDSSARDIVCEWLNQTEKESEKYSDAAVREFALHLLSREIVKGATKK